MKRQGEGMERGMKDECRERNMQSGCTLNMRSRLVFVYTEVTSRVDLQPFSPFSSDRASTTITIMYTTS